MPNWRDEFELLCERCGYSVDSLARGGNCPECGTPIAESLPGARAGSPWQRRAGLGGWLATMGAALFRPVGMVRGLRVDDSGARRLQRLNLGLAAVVIGASGAFAQHRFGVVESLGLARNSHAVAPWVGGVRVGAVGVVAAVGAFLAFSGATAVERWGIQLFGRAHKKRITPTLARALTAHASAGWVAAAALFALGIAAGTAIHEAAMGRNVGAVRGAMMLSPLLLAILGGFVGMLWFETVVYLGVLGRKFANRERAGGAGATGADQRLRPGAGAGRG